MAVWDSFLLNNVKILAEGNMSINVSAINSQANQMRIQANNLRGEVRRALQLYRQDLNRDWRGQEMTLIDDAINTMLIRINTVANDIDGAAGDIVRAAEQIRREEEVARAAVAAAAAAAARAGE